MAIEDAVLRLARAIEAQGESSAVREIIRQRDDARRELNAMQGSRDYYRSRTEDETKANTRLHRRIAALQGVITRMKHKAEASHG